MNLWVSLQLQPPSFVIGEMPVKNVHLHLAHQVKVSLDKFFAKEMSSFVKHIATMPKTRRILDLNCRDFAPAGQLPQSLQRVEATGFVR